jgi:hypothetical protein
MRYKTTPRICVLAGLLPVCGAHARPDLYNNGPYFTAPGAAAGGAALSPMQSQLGCTSFGFNHQMVSPAWRLTDDFTVSDPAGWTVSSVVVYAFQTNSGTATSPFTHLNLRIWSGRTGDATSTIVFGDTTTNRLGPTSWTNCYRAKDVEPLNTTRPIFANEGLVSPALHLPPGTYWLDWQASSLTWQALGIPVTIEGMPGAPNGNARKFEAATGQWTTLHEGGTLATQELAFIVRGTIGSGGGGTCYANCDGSTLSPVLNVNDFVCFSNRFAAGDSRANCDASTTPPTLNVNDFVCFTNRFSAGCPAP